MEPDELAAGSYRGVNVHIELELCQSAHTGKPPLLKENELAYASLLAHCGSLCSPTQLVKKRNSHRDFRGTLTANKPEQDWRQSQLTEGDMWGTPSTDDPLRAWSQCQQILRGGDPWTRTWENRPGSTSSNSGESRRRELGQRESTQEDGEVEEIRRVHLCNTFQLRSKGFTQEGIMEGIMERSDPT
ncbi:unnamed protein product [Pleuronectes platessa]|uniref:Uncharacterized protein n=1 Tax=Pleuronectes platessa TaxID=8262 RepID=A0A9N7VUR4_PLEPL|nr:unnamed protein product [Pleuronectes platessa]